MRNSLTSGVIVEAVVTVAVAILMTVAGFEMLRGAGDDASSTLRPKSVNGATSIPQMGAAFVTPVVETIRFPHVDVAPA